MRVATGTVVNGKVVLEGVVLPEGALVTVLASDTQAGVRLSPEDEAELLAAVDEADQEAGSPADEVLERLRKYG
jgi:hypothetical protein